MHIQKNSSIISCEFYRLVKYEFNKTHWIVNAQSHVPYAFDQGCIAATYASFGQINLISQIDIIEKYALNMHWYTLARSYSIFAYQQTLIICQKRMNTSTNDIILSWHTGLPTISIIWKMLFPCNKDSGVTVEMFTVNWYFFLLVVYRVVKRTIDFHCVWKYMYLLLIIQLLWTNNNIFFTYILQLLDLLVGQ